MYSILGTGDILVHMLRSWWKLKVNQHMSTRISATVRTSQLSLVSSHDRKACGYVHTHIELFRGMYSILGTGDILVHMLRSWWNVKVNQHMSTCMSATVRTSSTLSCQLTRSESMQICSHAYRTVQRYV